MNKNELIELYNSFCAEEEIVEIGSEIIASKPHDKLFWSNDIDEELNLTDFIINDLLPAIRKDKKFQEGFSDWLDDDVYEIWEELSVELSSRVDNEEKFHEITNNFMLHYEREYIKEILGE